ncbi:MAG: glucose-1-phosphate adenylyltransferase, partial [Clostridia bacterium]|nr:glucose-1-phosphate adenylyltransferase [Clostridia bacterium]
MYCKKECIAMLLAGGQGSRLYDLTKQIAKPAVSFGGKYKIIDFPLSNCINSGIDTVGVLTQYQPFALNEYVANGTPWDLDRIRGGLYVLPPYQGNKTSDWYKGTANAIYQNINFIKQYDPDYVLILSGDHIYRMDYNKMLQQHKATGAACTVATITVPMDEASRFGICNTNPDGSIYEFEEKPKNPKNNQASMGIYIFSTKTLIEYLVNDEADENSSNDFGKNIIPNLLGNGEKLYSYRFEGYWKDVGTISSLWEANMDLIGENPILTLADQDFRIYSKNTARPPQYIGQDAVVENS